MAAVKPPMDRDHFDGRRLYLRLLVYVRPYWKAFALAVACMGLSSIVEPAFPALMKYLLDDGFAKAQGSWDWLIYPGAIFAIFLTRAVIGFAGDYAMAWVSQNIIMEMRRTMFANMILLPTRYYTENSSGRLITRMINDVGGVTGAATTALTTSIKDSLSIIGLVGWLLYLNWKLTLITFVMIPFIAVSVRYFSRRVRRLARQVQDYRGLLLQVLQEAIDGHKVVKIFGGQSYERERFQKISGDMRRLFMRLAVSNAAQGPIVQFFAALALSIIMGIALKQASDGQATVGDFVSFITAMLMTLAPMKRLTDINSTIQQGLVAAESVFHLVDEAPEPDAGQVDLAVARGEVEFRDVVFTYPGAQRPALDGLSFALRPGECVALVGPSGSGKTTVANLLPRFYGIDAGEIRVDGHPIGDIGLAGLRRNIALVSQEVVLFNDTVAANIAYGCTRKVDEKDIREAAIAAHAMEFIENLPEGLNTVIGEKGVKLSGGQRQRLAIARALLKNAPILILDEATSALDTESERVVQAALDRLMEGRSTLVIAHRLSTVEGADRILVMRSGQVAEQGTHGELLARNGLYASLYRTQLEA